MALDLAKLKEMEASLTPGEWRVDHWSTDAWSVDAYHTAHNGHVVADMSWVNSPERNARFIAAVRNAFPNF
jgi:hypothetical protein